MGKLKNVNSLVAIGFFVSSFYHLEQRKRTKHEKFSVLG